MRGQGGKEPHPSRSGMSGARRCASATNFSRATRGYAPPRKGVKAHRVDRSLPRRKTMTRRWLIMPIVALSFGTAACGDYDDKNAAYDEKNAAYDAEGNAGYDAGDAGNTAY